MLTDDQKKAISEEAKFIFSKNIKKWLDITGKSQSDIVSDLGITASTVSDWVNGKKYPRVDKIQMLADYFGILKTDLTEESPTTPEDDERLKIIKSIMKSLENKPDDFLEDICNYIEFKSQKKGIG